MTPRFMRLRAKVDALLDIPLPQPVPVPRPSVVLRKPDADAPSDVWEAHREEVARLEAAGVRVTVVRHFVVHATTA